MIFHLSKKGKGTHSISIEVILNEFKLGRAKTNKLDRYLVELKQPLL